MNEAITDALKTIERSLNSGGQGKVDAFKQAHVDYHRAGGTDIVEDYKRYRYRRLYWNSAKCFVALLLYLVGVWVIIGFLESLQ